MKYDIYAEFREFGVGTRVVSGFVMPEAADEELHEVQGARDQIQASFGAGRLTQMTLFLRDINNGEITMPQKFLENCTLTLRILEVK